MTIPLFFTVFRVVIPSKARYLHSSRVASHAFGLASLFGNTSFTLVRKAKWSLGAAGADVKFRSASALHGLGAILTGFLLFAAFPPLEWSAFAWMALVPLVFVSAFATPRAAFRYGFLSGLIFWLPSLAWLTRVTWIGWCLLSAYCALFLAGFALSVSWFLARKGLVPRWGNPVLTLSIPMVWVGWEYLRCTLFSGFPWNQLGVSQYANLPLIQGARLGGVYLVSYLVVLVNAALALSIVQAVRSLPGARARLPRELLIALGIVVAALWLGQAALRTAPAVADTLKIAAVQVNIPQVEKWSEDWTSEINDRLRRTSRRAIDQSAPDLIVWPETALPDFVRSSPASQEVIDDVLKYREGVAVLMGSMDFSDTGSAVQYFNSAFLFKSDGLVPQTYAKRRLVLFGEYIPFERWIPFLRALTPMEESFTAGREATVFQLGSRAFAVLICFEDTVAAVVRDSVRSGARLLINQTNDAWFDPSWASRQHMTHCVFRCVENSVSAVRATNTGITCFIDSQGRIVSRLPRAKGSLPDPEYLAGSVTLPPASAPLTFYTRQGDILALGCLAFTLALVAGMLRVRRAN